MTSDDNIKKMGALLREGAKMLDYSCPECNNLLFQLKNGKILCPTCNREVIFKTDENINIESDKSLTQDKRISSLSDIILIEIEKYTKILNTSFQLSQVKEILDIIEKLIDIYIKISKVK